MNEFPKGGLLEDSLSRRVIEAVAPIINFTYGVFAPPDKHHGTLRVNGSWTGVIGLLQKGEVDVTFMITNSDKSYPIIDLARLVPSDTVVIVTLKPRSLPQYFVIVQPFTVEVWMYIAASILIWALFFWFLQNLRSETVGGERVTFNWSIFHSFAVILEDPPPSIPTHTIGQILLGVWLITCLIIITYFRSSLVALLSVQSKTQPIDSFEDLISLDHKWNFGLYDVMLRGQPKLYFTNEKDPVIKEVYRRSESIRLDAGLEKVMRENYAFLVTNNRVSLAIALNYTDDRGQTPFYVSRRSYVVASDFGWGFRKGFPNFSRFSKIFNRLTEAGLTDYWLKDVLNSEFRKIRRQNRETRDPSEALKYSKLDQVENQITVTTSHMIGVYLTGIIGFFLSFVVFLTEIIFSEFPLTKSSFERSRLPDQYY
ncbi:glutamate receptor ionotropic, kainate glr-3-like [Palaemon carinicauda]|uniref:glutamate receptor ionotropic, kainate glr-3-like n=1 Tax=Palaemon carinicauda TaxID=392227 RepID=UPI0035B57793